MNIVIDTSIIIQENYLSGKKLKRLGILSHQKKINLFFTSIIDREINSNIHSECIKLDQLQTTLKRSLENKHRIVKTFYDVEKLQFINTVSFKSALINKFERFKKYANIRIIEPTDGFLISEIIDDYFKNKPPFRNTQKKNEFPDALSYKIANDYFKSKKTHAVFLTIDKDFDGITSSNLKVKSNISELLEEIVKDLNPQIFDERNNIQNSINSNLDKFTKAIQEEIELDIMIYHMDIFDKYFLESMTDNQKTRELKIDNFEIFDISDGLVGFKCSGCYISDLYYLLEKNFNEETLKDLLREENLILREGKFIRYKGEFETTIYYEYEFPYNPIEDTIEVDDKKSITSIESI